MPGKVGSFSVFWCKGGLLKSLERLSFPVVWFTGIFGGARRGRVVFLLLDCCRFRNYGCNTNLTMTLVLQEGEKHLLGIS